MTTTPQELPDALAAIELAGRVHRLGHAVGDEAQELAGADPALRAAIDEIVDRAKRRSTAIFDPDDGSIGRIRDVRILVTRVAIDEVAGIEVEDAGERGDEQHFRVVARNLGVRERHQVADVRPRRAQDRALAQRLADRHEDARREAFPGDVADQKEQMTLVESKEIVEIAADFARRDHRCGEVDPAVVAQELGAGQ